MGNCVEEYPSNRRVPRRLASKDDLDRLPLAGGGTKETLDAKPLSSHLPYGSLRKNKTA